MISDRERVEVRTSWPAPSLMFRLLAELEAAEAKAAAVRNRLFSGPAHPAADIVAILDGAA